jgi:hypothetical protein
MKNILIEQKKIKLWNKWHFVENETEIPQYVLKMQLPKYKNGYLGVFSYVCSHMRTQVFKKDNAT